ERHDLTNCCERERFKRTRHGYLTVPHFRGQHLGREHLFIELLAQFQRLDVIKKLDDLFVGAVTKRTQKRGGQKFPAAFPAIEIDVKQVGGIELDFDPGATVGDDAKTVKHLAGEVDRR